MRPRCERCGGSLLRDGEGVPGCILCGWRKEQPWESWEVRMARRRLGGEGGDVVAVREGKGETCDG